MRTLLLTALVCLSCFCYSQNAYYDMLELVKWSRLNDTSVEKRNNAEPMLVKLLKYSGGTSKPFSDTARNLFIKKIYSEADSIYSFNERYKIARDYVITRMISLVPPKSITDPKDILDLVDISNIAKLRKQHEDEYNEFLKFKSAYEKELKQFTKSKNENQLIKAIEEVFNAIRKDPTNGFNIDVVNFTTSLSSINWEKMKTVSEREFDSLLTSVQQISEYIQLIYIHSSNLLNKVKTDENDIYNKTMALSSYAIRYIFEELKLQPEEINRAFRNESSLSIKSSIEEMKYQHLAEASGSQRLSDMNFPTQTEIIDAIALYLVKRAKQEAALLFIEKLSDAIKSDELAQDLFPATWRIMQMEEAYTQPRFGAQWRNAIATDYIALPQNIVNSKYLEKRLPDGDLRNCFSDAVLFGTYVARKYNFIDIIRTLHSDHSRLKGKWTSIGVDVMYIINEELYDSTQQRYWISPQALFELDTDQLLCLYDLIRIKYRSKVCTPLRTLFDDLDRVKQQLEPKRRFYTELLTILQQFYVAQTVPVKSSDGSTVIKDGFWDTQRTFIDILCENQEMLKLTLKEVKALKLCQSAFYVYDYVSNKNYIAAADHIVGILSTLLQNSRKGLVNISAKELSLLGTKTSSFSQLLNETNKTFDNLLLLRSIGTSLKTEADTRLLDMSYFTGRFDLDAQIINSLFGKEKNIAVSELKKRLNELDISYTKLVIEKYEGLKSTLTDSEKDLLSWHKKQLYRNKKKLTPDLLYNAQFAALKENSVYFKWLTDFSGLLTEIVNARDRTALASVIESHALPTGSYRGKRNANFSIDLNAYVGGYGAFEKIKDDNTFRFVYGLTAPIGVSFTWGTRRKKQDNDDDLQKTYITKQGKLKYRTQNSFTLDLSLIDIGAAVSYRLSDTDESKGLPSEVKWDQVLAYGVNARWGIRKTPLCFGIGVQKTPQLRSFNGELRDAWRVHATFTFDLPLFNIHRSWD